MRIIPGQDKTYPLPCEEVFCQVHENYSFYSIQLLKREMGIFQRDPVDNLFSLSSDEYLDRFNVRCYLNDVVHQLLECRDDRPLEFMSEYFLAVSKGTHVTHRSFSYVMSTQYNRCSFALMTRAAYDESAFTSSISLEDFSQLVFLICTDFPSVILKDVYNTVSHTTASLRVLLEAVGIHVYFYDFFTELKKILLESAGETLTRRSVTVSIMCLLSKKNRSASPPVADCETTQSTSFDAFYGKQTAVVNPSREVLMIVINSAVEKSGGISSQDEAQLSSDLLLLELYTSQLLFHEIFQPHPSLNALIDKSVDEIVTTIHHTHETMITTGRKRKVKNQTG